MRMSPQERSIELAKRLVAIQAVGHALAWYSLVQRGAPELPTLMSKVVLAAEALTGAQDLAAPVLGERQLILLKALQEGLSSPEPDLLRIQANARELIDLGGTDCSLLPSAETELADLVAGWEALEEEDSGA